MFSDIVAHIEPLYGPEEAASWLGNASAACETLEEAEAFGLL